MGAKLNRSPVQYLGIATPVGNPPAGQFFYYFKADGNNYRLDSAGNEIQLNVSGNPIRELSTTEGIDGKVVATTNLFTVPVGETAIVTRVDIIPTDVIAFVNRMRAGVGIAAGEDDIMGSMNINGLNQTDEVFSFIPDGVFAVGVAASVIKLGIDTGANAGTYEVKVMLSGYTFF